MEHILYECPHYSTKLWEEVSAILTTLASETTGKQVARICLTPREIIYNVPHPSIALHFKDTQSIKSLIHYIQETKRDILYRRMNTRINQHGQQTPTIRIQAHILSVIKKLHSMLEYQGLLANKTALKMLNQMKRIIEEKIQ
jgi:hypothetical protein